MPIVALGKLEKAAGRMLLQTRSPKLFRVCIKEAVNLSGANYGSLFLEQEGRLVRVYSNVPKDLRINPRVGGNTYQSFRKDKIKFVNRSQVVKSHPDAPPELKLIVIIPLVYQSKRLGVITLQSDKTIHKDNKLLKKTLRMFSTFATLAIRNMQLLEETKSAVKTRELFISTAAHELRNPLTSVLAYATLVEKKLSVNGNIEKTWIDSIISNGRRIENLIKDLFSLSQMGMGIFNYKFAKTEVVSLVEKIVDESQVLHKRSIILTKKLDNKKIFLRADSEKLELVMSNIIGNAVKYSEPKTRIEVLLLKKRDNIYLSVKDEGKGIAKEDLPYVFEKFYRGQSVNASAGFGLGMYLCKQVTEAHNGEITVKSKVGKGTTVRIKLPLKNNGRKKTVKSSRNT